MASEISWEELEEKVGKIEPGQILELNLLRKGFILQTIFSVWWVVSLASIFLADGRQRDNPALGFNE